MPEISVNHVHPLEAELRKKDRTYELKIATGNKTRLLLVISKLGLAVGLFAPCIAPDVNPTTVQGVRLVARKVPPNGFSTFVSNLVACNHSLRVCF